MKPILLLVLGVFFNLHFASAQSLSPGVISTSGSFYQSGNGMLSSTIGEMTMVETFSSGNSILTQGFQQVYDFNVGIPQQPKPLFFDVYPNPSSGNFTVAIPDGTNEKVEVVVIDAIGKLVYRKSFPAHADNSRISLSLNNLVEGMYVMEIKTNTNHHFKKVNIIK